jgi:hypothetical protein
MLASIDQDPPKSKTNPWYRSLEIVLATVVFYHLTGCAMYSANNRIERILDGGAAYINAIGVQHRRGEVILHSIGRIDGPEIPANEDSIETALELGTDWGNLRVLVPTSEVVRSRMGYFFNGLESEYPAAAIQTLDQTLERLPRLGSHSINLSILFAPPGSGYSISNRTTLADDMLDLSFVALVNSPSDDVGPQAPWVHAVRALSHEMLHVEHKLRGMDQTGSGNGEAAATLFEYCANADFLANAGLMNEEVRIRIGKPEDVKRAFPGLDEGRFQPIMDLVDRGQDPSWLGHLLGQAVVYSQSDEGAINLTNPSIHAFLDDRCRYLAQDIPAYADGEW